MKSTTFNPALLLEKDATIKVTRVMQPEDHFVIVARRAYHGRLNNAQNAAKVTNFTELSWIEPGRVGVRNIEASRPFNNQFSLSSSL